jgi:hypothetical protein
VETGLESGLDKFERFWLLESQNFHVANWAIHFLNGHAFDDSNGDFTFAAGTYKLQSLPMVFPRRHKLHWLKVVV